MKHYFVRPKPYDVQGMIDKLYFGLYKKLDEYQDAHFYKYQRSLVALAGRIRISDERIFYMTRGSGIDIVEAVLWDGLDIKFGHVCKDNIQTDNSFGIFTDMTIKSDLPREEVEEELIKLILCLT